VKSKLVPLIAAVTITAAALAACGGSGGSGNSKATAPATAAADHTPVTITIWSGFTDRELGILGKTLDTFHTSHPWITVKSVGGVDDDKIVKSIRAGNAPDVALSFEADHIGTYCSSGAWINLGPYITRDKVDLSQIPKASLEYTQFNNDRCAMPALADTYGLYYNTDLFKAAGYTDPPKTASELLQMAVKLTTYNPDGSIKVLGFDPLWGVMEMAPAHVAPLWNAQWEGSDGKSNFAADPHWAAMIQWQKQFVDAIGYKKLLRFSSGAGDSEFAATNLFETGKLAMNIDGEYRTAFIASEHPNLNYNTAPMPVDDSQPSLYGAGYVVGNTLGIPKTSSGRQREAAWQLVKWLSIDPAAEVPLANQLKNVPTVTAALNDPTLTQDAKFATFLKIFANPASATTPSNAGGSADQDLLSAYINKYEAGNGGDLAQGLAATDKQVNAQVQQATGGGAP
jgi:multiple sugar transport system substrate-binding protein